MSRSHVTTRGSLDSAGRETRCLAERPTAYPTATRPAGDGAVADPAVVAEAWDNWRGQVAFAEQFVAAQQDLGAMASFDNGLGEQDSISVREALVHMIEEYARHMGHADFLRERIDGRVGQ